MNWGNYFVNIQKYPLDEKSLASAKFEITDVFPGSPAEAAGIKQGMLFLSNKKYIFEETEIKEKFQYTPQKIYIADPKTQTLIIIEAKGFLYGLNMRRALPVLCEDLAYLDHWTTTPFEYVHLNDPNVLLKLKNAIEAPNKTNVFSHMSRTLAPLISAPNAERDYFYEMLAYLFSGLKYFYRKIVYSNKKVIDLRDEVFLLIPALYYANRGELEKTVKLIKRFEASEDVRLGLITSLYYYLKCIIAEKENKDEEEINYWLSHAYDSNKESELIKNKIAERGIELSEPNEEEGNIPFPLSYVLLRRDPLYEKPAQANLVSFNGALSKLHDDQFLIIISLGSYRANGPYSDAMYNLSMIYPILHNFFPEVHIITGYEPGGRHFDDWEAGEEYAKKINIPIQVLYDPEFLLPEMLYANSSPHGVIVNKQGNIVYKGNFGDEKCFWKAITSLNAQSQLKETAAT